MKKFIPWLVGAALAALASLTWAQVNQIGSGTAGYSGNEAWMCAQGVPSGPSFFCTVGSVQVTTQMVATNFATGTLGTGQNNRLIVFNAALSGGVTLTTPVAPLAQQVIEVANGTGSAFTQTITFTASGTQTVVNGAVATLAAGAGAAWAYNASNTTWYRIR